MANDEGEEKKAKAATRPKGGVVQQRRVVSRPMKQGEVAAAAENLAASNPNAPKPIPTSEYKPRLVMMKRRHKPSGGEKKVPSGMSDIKI